MTVHTRTFLQSKAAAPPTEKDSPGRSPALLPVWTDVAEELCKVIKISPNCHLTFKNDTGISILQHQVYLDDKQHIHTWILLKFPFPSADSSISRPQRLSGLVPFWWLRASDILPSGAFPSLLWPPTSDRAYVQIDRQVALFAHFPGVSAHLNVTTTTYICMGPCKAAIRAFPQV